MQRGDQKDMLSVADTSAGASNDYPAEQASPHPAAWVILAFNSIFSALTCLTMYWIAKRMYGLTVARATAWTWAFFPYAIYWPTRVVWETSLTAFLLSVALLLTLRMADLTPRQRNWIIFGLLWGVIALTNTAVLSMV